MRTPLRLTLIAAAVAGGLAFAADPAPAPSTAPAPAPELPNGGLRKDCEQLKAEIAGRMDAKGVKNYTLRVVTNEEAAAATDEKVVGTCNGGTGKVLYKRN